MSFLCKQFLVLENKIVQNHLNGNINHQYLPDLFCRDKHFLKIIWLSASKPPDNSVDMPMTVTLTRPNCFSVQFPTVRCRSHSPDHNNNLPKEQVTSSFIFLGIMAVGLPMIGSHAEWLAIKNRYVVIWTRWYFGASRYLCSWKR